MLGNRSIVNIPAGINKDDNTFTSLTYTDADKVRFYHGLPEKIGGWISVDYDNYQELKGVPRTIYSYISNDGTEHIIIGTHTRLYTFEGGKLYNITPLVTSTTAIANSLATNFVTLGTTPIHTDLGSTVVTVNFSTLDPLVLREDDIINIAGVAAPIGGVPFAEINGVHAIFNINAMNNTFNIIVTTAATSTANGGTGATIGTKVITVDATAHGFLDGDKVKIAAATGFDTFMAADLNIESLVRYIDVDTFAYYLNAAAVYSTSSSSAQGGAATTMQGQIDPGVCTFTGVSGYGGGNYGEGDYNTDKDFDIDAFLPRIWSIDRYADSIVATPGNQSALYQWNNDVFTSPTIISGAPTAINYTFVAQVENQVVTFGAGGDVNRVKTSDSDLITSWTPDATNLAFDVKIEGAGRLISHSYVKGQYLLFGGSAVYTMYFVGKPDIWIIKLLTTADGIIGPNAVTELPDAVVWQGQNNFYIYNGSIVNQIANNTMLQWIYANASETLGYIGFARKVIEFNEVWWFFASGNIEEPDTYVIWNYEEGHWTNGRMIRTAAEELNNPSRSQYMAIGSCDESIPSTLYQHEVGYADDEANMTGSLTTNYSLIAAGDAVQQISSIIPSDYPLPIGEIFTNEELYSMTVNTKEYDGNTAPRVFGPYIIKANTGKIDTRIVGRQRQYVYNFSNQIGFRIQKTYETLKPFTLR